MVIVWDVDGPTGRRGSCEAADRQAARAKGTKVLVRTKSEILYWLTAALFDSLGGWVLQAQGFSRGRRQDLSEMRVVA